MMTLATPSSSGTPTPRSPRVLTRLASRLKMATSALKVVAK
jgi:hypothetical protein